MNRQRAIVMCEQVVVDMASDVNEFEGAYFTGKAVSTMFGRQAAAIAGLATVLRLLIEDGFDS